MEKQRLLENPPEKVLLMYRAVVDMINEGCDVNTMKVSDITDPEPGSAREQPTNIFHPRKRSSPWHFAMTCCLSREKWKKSWMEAASFQKK